MSSVTLGMTTKGINSTSRQMSAGVTLDCKLKDPVCGLHSPVFKVKGLSKAYNNYNYCLWRDRYYWVDEILFLTNDIQEVHCHLDPLATFKGAIDDTQAFVQYADVGHWNKWCDDPRINPEFEDPAFSKDFYIDVIPDITPTGFIVMSYMDCGLYGASSNGGVRTVVMTPTDFYNMLDNLYSLLNGKAIDEIYSYLGGCGAWRDNIISCRYVPFFNFGGTPVTSITIGGIQCTVNAQMISPIVTKNGTGSISLDWSDFDTRPYLKNSRWTTLQFVTPFGYTEIPIDSLVGQGYVYVYSTVVKTTGDIIIKLCEEINGNGQVYAMHSGNVGVDLMTQLGSGHGFRQAVQSAMGVGAQVAMAAATAGMSVGGAMMTQNMVDSGMLGGGSSSIAGHEMASANVRQTTMSSGINALSSMGAPRQASVASGSISANIAMLFNNAQYGRGQWVRKTYRQFDLGAYDDFCNEFGYPCNKYLTLSSISGYCKCSGAFIRNIPGATPADISTINSFLNNGIVLEA